MATWTVTLTSCITHRQVFGHENGLATTRSTKGSHGGLLAMAKAQAAQCGTDEAMAREAAAREAATVIVRDAANREATNIITRDAMARDAAAQDAATQDATDREGADEQGEYAALAWFG